jgi:GT2 family glycosyltransferase
MTSGQPAPGEPRISVLLSTLGNYDVLRRVLDGYSQQDAALGSFEMIVVADRADPHLERVDAAIDSRPFPVRRITGRIPGLSANRNTGCAEARAPIILITDNDTIPCRRLVSEHLDWHERHPEEEVVVTGHVRWAPELKRTAFMRWLDYGVQFDFPSIKGIEAHWANVYGANASIKRSFVERVGGWDEERLPYLYDDLDWSYRASKHGLRVLYNRRAVVDHVRYDANLDFWKQKMDRLARAEYRFTAIHPEIEPWFFKMFSDAAAVPPVRGRAARIASFVPRALPVLGRRVWWQAGLYWRQQLAPYFLEAWEDASRSAESQPAGSSPGGPK